MSGKALAAGFVRADSQAEIPAASALPLTAVRTQPHFKYF